MQAYIESLLEQEEAKLHDAPTDLNDLREFTLFNANSKSKRKLNKLQQRVLDAFVGGICGVKGKVEGKGAGKKRRKMPGRTLYSRRIDSLSTCFAAMDRDKDGTVSFNELSRAARRLGLGLSSHDVQVLMSVYDFDRNGEVDLEEFVSVSSLSEHAVVKVPPRSRAAQARDERFDILGLAKLVPVAQLSDSGSLVWG